MWNAQNKVRDEGQDCALRTVNNGKGAGQWIQRNKMPSRRCHRAYDRGWFIEESSDRIFLLGQLSDGEGNGSPLQFSCLETSVDRGTWWAIQFMRSKRVGHNWATELVSQKQNDIQWIDSLKSLAVLVEQCHWSDGEVETRLECN